MAKGHSGQPLEPGHGRGNALICDEAAHLFNALFAVASDTGHVLDWSLFRRSHQANVHQCHHRRQALQEL